MALAIKREKKQFLGKKDCHMKIKLERHRNELRLLVFFDYDPAIIQKIRKIEGSHWSQSKRCWHLPATPESVRGLLEVFPELEIPVLPGTKEKKAYWGEKRDDFNARKRPKPRGGELKPLTEAQKKLVEKLRGQLEMERYAYSTIKGYTIHFSHFMRYHHPKTADELEIDDIRKFMLYLVRSKKVAASTQNQAINAIKAYYEKVRKMPKIILELERPRKPQQIPTVLTREEVKRLIDGVANVKHRCLLLITYSAGLRLSEVINLRVRDIHFTRGVIFIRAGKGKKDRYTVLSKRLVPLLKRYLKQYHPKNYLFEGHAGGRYGKRTAQNVFTNARDRVGVNKDATFHTLRHSFATHALDANQNLKQIQEALGHNSLRTTERYLHINAEGLKRMESPLDREEWDIEDQS